VANEATLFLNIRTLGLFFKRFPIPLLMSPGIVFAHLTATVHRARILIKLPAVKLRQLPKQTSSVLPVGADLPAHRAPLCSALAVPAGTMLGTAAAGPQAPGRQRCRRGSGPGPSPASSRPALQAADPHATPGTGRAGGPCRAARRGAEKQGGCPRVIGHGWAEPQSDAMSQVSAPSDRWARQLRQSRAGGQLPASPWPAPAESLPWAWGGHHGNKQNKPGWARHRTKTWCRVCGRQLRVSQREMCPGGSSTQFSVKAPPSSIHSSLRDIGPPSPPPSLPAHPSRWASFFSRSWMTSSSTRMVCWLVSRTPSRDCSWD